MSTPRLAEAWLDSQCAMSLSALPQAVRDPMGLQGVESLEMEQRVQSGAAGGIVGDDGPQVGLERIPGPPDPRPACRGRASAGSRSAARCPHASRRESTALTMRAGRASKSGLVDQLAQHRLARGHLDGLPGRSPTRARAAERQGGPPARRSLQGPIRSVSPPPLADRSEGEGRVVFLLSGMLPRIRMTLISGLHGWKGAPDGQAARRVDPPGCGLRMRRGGAVPAASGAGPAARRPRRPGRSATPRRRHRAPRRRPGRARNAALAAMPSR